MKQGLLASLTFIAALGLPLAARADLVAQGPDVPVNATTAGSQVGVTGRSIAGTRDTIVGVWQSDDGDGTGIVVRTADGTGILGPESFVNTTTTGNQSAAAVATAPGVGFVVVWTGDGADGDGSGIVARRYDATGAALGTEFLVNEFSTASQEAPNVAMGGDGSFVVVWQSFLQDGDQLGIVGRRFDSAGAALGTEFGVNEFTTGTQSQASPALLGNGGFVVVWDSEGSDGDGRAAVGRVFDDTGAPVGGDLALNAYTTGDQLAPHVAADADGGFVAVWSGAGSVDADGVTAGVFSADGTPLSGDVAVNEYTTGGQGHAAVGSDDHGNFVVVWDSSGQDGSGYGVFARRFVPGPVPDGTDLQVNTYTTGFQRSANSIAADGTGKYVVLWADADLDGDSFGLFARSLCTDSDGDGDCDPACGAVPATGCRTTEAGKSKLLIKDSIDDGRDLLKWKWGNGAATTLMAFLDPVAGAPDYVLCIYDGAVPGEPVLESTIPAGTVCDGGPCWKAAGSKGYAYRDKAAQHGGIFKAKLKSGDDGKAQVQILAKGTGVQPPAPPLTAPVVVQLLAAGSGDSECWESTFTVDAKNKVGSKVSSYKAKGP